MTGAGELNRRLVVRKRVSVGEDDHGATQYDYAPQEPSLACRRRDLSSAERMRADGLGSALAARFRVRDCTETRAIDANDQVEVDGVIWDLMGPPMQVAEPGPRFLELTGKAALTDG